MNRRSFIAGLLAAPIVANSALVLPKNELVRPDLIQLTYKYKYKYEFFGEVDYTLVHTINPLTGLVERELISVRKDSKIEICIPACTLSKESLEKLIVNKDDIFACIPKIVRIIKDDLYYSDKYNRMPDEQWTGSITITLD